MTSRPSVGMQRQPQRSLSGLGSVTVSASAPRRALNTQPHRPASPLKKENFIDLTDDGPSEAPTPSRQVSAAKLGGSRLKLEISHHDPSVTPSSASPRPADVLMPSKPFPTPRGRPRFYFDGPPVSFAPQDAVPLSMPPEDSTNFNQQPLPMPVRPHQHTRPTTVKQPTRAPPAPVKKDSRPKPYNLEPPADAPKYPPNGHADFFPWTGHHPEDVFNETIIRQGYSEKPSAQTETSSAKGLLLPVLKHKSGLQTLSSLFTGVLSLRRSHGQITSNSTFKPPPRVTLTDTKREMWLRDLANSAIPLRRLSRTIPHGIRGKVLLEQCLSKNIPTERAVWLAKCVGANEIRAFKRKGISGTFAMGGEVKWIRDWTAFVEQFLESIVNACGETEWKSRVTYAVRLAANLYAEHLLDREHYLDWLTTSIENCPLSKVPIWLLMTQVYWKHLLQHRKYGRRLAGAVCNHLYTSYNSVDRDLFAPITDRIVYLLRDLLSKHPQNFVAPALWSKYADTIRVTVAVNDIHLQTIVDDLDRRNKRFSSASTKSDNSPRRRIIQLLDSSIVHSVTDNLIHQCADLTNDRALMAQAVLEWATSAYRPGLTKIYVATRLLRKWAHQDVNITDVLLTFLSTHRAVANCDDQAVYHLASELGRSGHFSVARYLQWLIARGGLNSPSELDRDAPCATRLLAELPVHNLSDNIADLRNRILHRAAFSVDEEEQAFEEYTTYMTSILGPTPSDSMDLDMKDVSFGFDSASRLPQLSRAVKSRIGNWLRRKVRERKSSTIGSAEAWKDAMAKEETMLLTPEAFNQIRLDLEAIDDYSMLADVLKLATSSSDITLLTSVANTVNLHADTLAAIGALKDLFEALLGRLRPMIARQSYNCRSLLVSLIKLATRSPSATAISSQLSQELIQIDRKTAADACSPVSDHMVEVIQNTEDFADELEKLLASGTSVDQPTLERLFHVIVSRLEASWLKFPEQQRGCGLLLARLRTFDPKTFDKLMLSWIQAFLQSSARQGMASVLAPLVSVDCVSLYNVITASLGSLDSSSVDLSVRPSLVLETLDLLTNQSSLPEVMTSEDVYSFRTAQSQFAKEHPAEMLGVIQRAAEATSLSFSADEGVRSQLSSRCRSGKVKELLKVLVLSDVNTARNSLVGAITSSNDVQVKSLLDCMIHSLVSPTTNGQPEQTLARINNALLLSDDLSLPFCQLEIEVVLATGVIDPNSEEDRRKQCLEALGNAIITAVSANSSTSWTSLMPVLDAGIVAQIREGAQRSFLDLYPHLKQSSTRNLDSQSNIESAKRLLFVIEATATDKVENSGLDFAAFLVEKFYHTWQLVSLGAPAIQQATAQNWLPLLLTTLNMSAGIFDSHKTGSELRARLLIALSALLVETGRHVPDATSQIEAIFDTAMVISDGLADDARMGCIRLLKDKSTDTRIQYILGYSARPMDWLQLNQKGKSIPFQPRRWELLSEPTPIVGENDTSLSLTLFQARKG